MNRVIRYDDKGRIAPADDRGDTINLGDVLWALRDEPLRCEKVGTVTAFAPASPLVELPATWQESWPAW